MYNVVLSTAQPKIVAKLCRSHMTSRVFLGIFDPPSPYRHAFPILFTQKVTLRLTPPPPLARDVICEWLRCLRDMNKT